MKNATTDADMTAELDYLRRMSVAQRPRSEDFDHAELMVSLGYAELDGARIRMTAAGRARLASAAA